MEKTRNMLRQGPRREQFKDYTIGMKGKCRLDVLGKKSGWIGPATVVALDPDKQNVKWKYGGSELWKSFADSMPLPLAPDGLADNVTRGVRIVKDAGVQVGGGAGGLAPVVADAATVPAVPVVAAAPVVPGEGSGGPAPVPALPDDTASGAPVPPVHALPDAPASVPALPDAPASVPALPGAGSGVPAPALTSSASAPGSSGSSRVSAPPPPRPVSRGALARPVAPADGPAGPVLADSLDVPADEWVVDSIVAHRRVGKGYQYKVKWAGGQGGPECTWEPGRNLRHSREVVDEYRRRAGLVAFDAGSGPAHIAYAAHEVPSVGDSVILSDGVQAIVDHVDGDNLDVQSFMAGSRRVHAASVHKVPTWREEAMELDQNYFDEPTAESAFFASSPVVQSPAPCVPVNLFDPMNLHSEMG